MSIQKILCATDFSPCSAAALEQAALLAERFGASLELVHVLAPPVVAAGGFELSPGVLEQQLSAIGEKASQELERLAEECRSRGLTCDAHKLSGTPHSALVDASAGADLLVMGTHGRTGLSRLLMGSVAELTLRLAKCPVIVVPPGEDEDTVTAKLEKIVVATDFSEDSDHALGWAHALAKQVGAELILIHAYGIPAFALPIDGNVISPATHAAALSNHAQDHLNELTGRYRGEGVPVRALLRSGVAYDEVNAAAEELEADLIVVGTHGRSGASRLLLGSVAERIVRLAERPVAVVSPTARTD